MSTKTWMHLACSLALGVSLAFMASLRSPVANAQNVSTGEWTASVEKQGSGINLNFDQTSELERTGERGSRHQFGQTYEFAELGLTREQVMNGGPVTFTLAREAERLAAKAVFKMEKALALSASPEIRVSLLQ